MAPQKIEWVRTDGVRREDGVHGTEMEAAVNIDRRNFEMKRSLVGKMAAGVKQRKAVNYNNIQTLWDMCECRMRLRTLPYTHRHATLTYPLLLLRTSFCCR